MGFELLPRDDPAQALRLRRTLLGFVSYLMFALPLGYSVAEGWVRFGWGGLAILVTVAIGINAVFFAIIRSGLNKRFADPSLTLPQIAAASLLALVVIHYSDEVRSIMLMLFYTSFFFGVFRLSTREFLALALFAAAGYFLLMQYEHAGRPFDESYRLELLRFLVLVMLLAWLSLFGGYVARLRTRLREQNHALDQALRQIEELAVTDPLTGAWNRRYLVEVLERERARAVRYGTVFSVVLADLDHFKAINDCYGHAAGDAVLQAFVAHARRTLRATDVFGRWGGEEFLLILPATDLAGAVRGAERLRAACTAQPALTAAGAVEWSVSLGVACYRPPEPIEETLARADKALYAAKTLGRNRVESF